MGVALIDADTLLLPSSTVQYNLGTKFYPDIPPRKSSYRHGLRTSRSGNSLGSAADTAGKPAPSEQGHFPKPSVSTNSLKSTSTSSGKQTKSIQNQGQGFHVTKTRNGVLSSYLLDGAETPDALSSKLAEAFPFPLSPKPLLSSKFLTPPPRRTRSVGAVPSISPSTPDRFVPSRDSNGDLTSAYRVSKNPKYLTPEERLSRNNGSSQDPFCARRISSSRRPAVLNSSRLQGSPTAANPQSRVASAGGVWNVGGVAPASSQRPVAGVPDGRGGLFGSGTTAPMYSSTFLNSETPRESQERYEGRLALALNIDCTSRILNLSHSSKKNSGPGCETSHSKHNTIWKDGGWVTVRPERGTANAAVVSIVQADNRLIGAKAAKDKPRAVPSTPFRYVN